MEREYTEKVKKHAVLQNNNLQSFRLASYTTIEIQSYDENGSFNELSSDNVKEKTTQMSDVFIENQILNHIERWLDSYYVIKDNMEKYAPNLAEYATTNYLKNNPFSFKPSYFQDIDSRTSIITKINFFDLLKDIFGQDFDAKIATHIKQEMPKIIDEVYPDRDTYFEHYLFQIPHKFDNDFYKNKINFDVIEYIQESPIKSFDFFMLKENSIRRSKALNNGYPKIYLNLPQSVKDFNEWAIDKEFSGTSIFSANLNEEQKQACLKTFNKLNRQNRDDYLQMQKEEITFMVLLDVIPDKENLRDSNNLYKNYNLPYGNELLGIIDASIKKHKINRAIEASPSDNDEQTTFKC